MRASDRYRQQLGISDDEAMVIATCKSVVGKSVQRAMSLYVRGRPVDADIDAIVGQHGFAVETHTTTTEDGHILTLHRIVGVNGVRAGAPVVYCHHGLMTNSELWVLGDATERCLPFKLVAEGYDVWLGNNRGNKYSNTHARWDLEDKEYWDFSIDEFARYDIPASIGYILQLTGETVLKYVGFSQGSSQLFASLAMNRELNGKIQHFTAISPVLVPQRLTHPVVAPLMLNPHYIEYIFGPKALLPFVPTVNSWLPSGLFNKVIDVSLQVLFQWNGINIPQSQKQVGYPHLYSTSSVKSVIHWFQIIRDQQFQLFNNTQSYNTSNIDTEVLLIYGDADCLVNIEKTCESLQSCKVETVRCPSYEHMDTLWAKDVENRVFNVILDKYRDIDGGREAIKSSGSLFL